MTHSMTAFARQQSEHEWGTLTWEIRSVNHRYLEHSFRIPETLRNLEPKFREILRKSVNRGKIEANLKLSSDRSTDAHININLGLLQSLQQASEQISASMPDCSRPNTLDILAWPGLIQPPAQNSKSIEESALTLLSSSVESLVQHRGSEGAQLNKFVTQRIKSISEIIQVIKTAMPSILDAQKNKLLTQFAELQMNVDPIRLEQEIVLLTHKADIDEEIDRINAHINEIHKTLVKPGPVGRRLDFLMQELNREANTICSKSTVTETTFDAVELKVLIEQMREQIQNIE